MTEKSIYEIQKEAVTIDHNSILLIKEPSLELVKLAYQSYISKIINGSPIKLNNAITNLLSYIMFVKIIPISLPIHLDPKTPKEFGFFIWKFILKSIGMSLVVGTLYSLFYFIF